MKFHQLSIWLLGTAGFCFEPSWSFVVSSKPSPFTRNSFSLKEKVKDEETVVNEILPLYELNTDGAFRNFKVNQLF